MHIRDHQATADPHTPHLKPLLSIKEFHQHFLGTIGINAIRTAVNEGRIQSIAVGLRKRLIPASELEAWPQREIEAAKCATN